MANFELIQIGENFYPAAITNYSLSMGEKLGLLRGSQLPDLLESNVIKGVIYLAVIGVNKDLNIPYDLFLTNYQVEDMDLIEQYKNIIVACTEMKDNNFAKAFLDCTSKKVDKNHKQFKSPKLNFECVEDRYVLYCLVYGIDSNVFWHHPIPEVERIYESKQAYDGWVKNPKTL